MSSPRWVLPLMSMSLLLAWSLTGCQNKPKQAGEEGRPAIAEQKAAAIREQYQRLDPGNRVGIVIAVREDLALAAIGDIPLQDFGINDVLTFIDARAEPFNTGVVVNATADALHVRFERERRAPRVGELAVRIAQ